MGGVSDRRGTAGLGLTVLTWAAAFPAIRTGLDGYRPWALGLLRLAVAAVALGVVALFRRPGTPSRHQWPRIVGCALVGQTLYQGLLMTGEVSVPAGTASVLIATAPIFSVLAAAVLLRERIGPRWKGFALAFAGAALAGGSLGVGGGAQALVVLAAALCQGVYHVGVKPLAEQMGALSATMWTVWAGALMSLVALPRFLTDAHRASGGSTAAAVLLGVVPSALGYLAWSDALARNRGPEHGRALPRARRGYRPRLGVARGTAEPPRGRGRSTRRRRRRPRQADARRHPVTGTAPVSCRGPATDTRRRSRDRGRAEDVRNVATWQLRGRSRPVKRSLPSRAGPLTPSARGGTAVVNRPYLRPRLAPGPDVTHGTV